MSEEAKIESINGLIELCNSGVSYTILDVLYQYSACDLKHNDLFKKVVEQSKEKVTLKDFIEAICRLKELGLLQVIKNGGENDE